MSSSVCALPMETGSDISSCDTKADASCEDRNTYMDYKNAAEIGVNLVQKRSASKRFQLSQQAQVNTELNRDQVAAHGAEQLVPTVDTMRRQHLPILGDDRIHVHSAVPVFSHNGSYIALFLPNSYMAPDFEFWKRTKDVQHFCRSRDGRHEALIQKFGGERSDLWRTNWEVVWKCAWPVQRNSSGCHDVVIVEATSEYRRHVGSVLACDQRMADEDHAYKMAACVRPLWEVSGRVNTSGLLKLPQWLEYNVMHGVEHFMIYTILSKDVERNITLKIAEPYFRAGLASHIDIDFPYEGDDSEADQKVAAQIAMANDCLYRFKGRSQWVMPSYDVDEYINLEGQTATTSFLELLPPLSNIHSVSIFGYRNIIVSDPMNMLEIESPRRCAHPQTAQPKYLANTDLTNALFIHWTTSYLPGTSDLPLDRSRAHVRHYRIDSAELCSCPDLTSRLQIDGCNSPEIQKLTNTSEVVDMSLTREAGILEQALAKRFGMRWRDLTAWAHSEILQ